MAERGIDVSHETVRFWWNRFGPMFAAEIRERVAHMRGYPQWRWHLDEVFVKVNGKLCYLWRAVDHEGEVLEAVVTAKRDKAAALKFLKRIMKKYGPPRKIVTDGLCSYSLSIDGARAIETNILAGQVLKEIGRLPEAQRETVLLVYAEGYSYSEAAGALGIPIGTVTSRLATARSALANLK